MTTIRERFLFVWYMRTFPLYRAYWRFRGWLTEAESVEQMIAQGKILVQVSRNGYRQHILKMEPTLKERKLWDEFREREATK